MSLYVGFYCSGTGAIYDSSTNNTRIIQLDQVGEDLLGLQAILEKLVEAAPPKNVKQLVYIHDAYIAKEQYCVSRALEAKAYRNFHLVHWTAVQLQALINKNNLDFTDNEIVIASVLRLTEAVTSFYQVLEGKLIYIKKIAHATVNNDELIRVVKTFMRDHPVHQWLNLKCAKVNQLVRNEFQDVRLCYRNEDYSWQETAETALFMAKKIDGLETGILVQNLTEIGVKIYVDDHLIVDNHAEPTGLPYNWNAREELNEELVDSILVDWDGLIKEWSVPSSSLENVRVQIDSNGVLSLKWGLSIAISLYKDSFIITCGYDSADDFRTPTVLGPFPTRLRFDKNPPEVTDQVSGNSIVSHILDNLDLNVTPGNGWMISPENYHVTTYSAANGAAKTISSLNALVCLLNVAYRKVNVRRAILRAIVIPDDFSENACNTIRNAVEMVSPLATLCDERRAMLLGHVMHHRLSEDDRLLHVVLSPTGYSIMLAEYSESKLSVLDEKEDKTPNSEEMLCRQREWLKEKYDSTQSEPASQPEDINISTLKVNEPLDNFCKIISKLLTKNTVNPDSVRVVLLLGEYHKIPLLESMLTWKFSNAALSTPTTGQLRQLAAIGGVYCHQSFDL